MSYFDASVIVAYYCPEKLSGQVEEMILKDHEPTLSTLTIVEFASAISRKNRERTISFENAKSIWEKFNFHRINGYYSMMSLEASHYHTAASFIMQLKTSLRALDALHLAITHESSERIITADKVLAKSAEKLGIPHLLIN
jgi:predicted nucleic acid-binding protein